MVTINSPAMISSSQFDTMLFLPHHSGWDRGRLAGLRRFENSIEKNFLEMKFLTMTRTSKDWHTPVFED